MPCLHIFVTYFLKLLGCSEYQVLFWRSEIAASEEVPKYFALLFSDAK
jgi:hypothetical protein